MSNKKNTRNNLADNETLYGIHAVLAMLKTTPQKIKRLTLYKKRQDPKFKEIISLAKLHHIIIEHSNTEHFSSAQGVIAHLNLGHDNQSNTSLSLESFFEHRKNKIPLFLILDGIQDPHNLGACIRTANGASVDAVIIPSDKASPLTATARKSASGAAEYTPVITVTNLSRAILYLKEQGVWIFGLAGEAKKSLYQENFRHPSAFVMGAEGTGLRQLTQSHCDELLSLPMLGEIESLNVSVAAGICLYEAIRQRHKIHP